MTYERISPKHPQYNEMLERRRNGEVICDAVNHHILGCPNPLCPSYNPKDKERTKSALEILLELLEEDERISKEILPYLTRVQENSLEFATKIKKDKRYYHAFFAMANGRIPYSKLDECFAICVAMMAFKEEIEKETKEG